MKKGPVVLAVLLTLTARAASADEPIEKPDDPPPHEPRQPLPIPRAVYQPPPPPYTGFEPALVLLQAAVAGALPIVAATQILPDFRSERALVWAVVTPLAVGASVCAVGNLSARYRGSCVPALAGAVVGAAAVVPLFFVGFGLDSASDSGEGDVHIPIFTIMLVGAGWLGLQPAAAFVAWHSFSRKRSEGPTINPPPLPPPPRNAFAPERLRGLAVAPGQMSFSLLSVGF